jgi:signal transduction histidine kinase
VSAIASRTIPVRASKKGGQGSSALRTERTIALIRAAVLAVVGALYLSGIGISSSRGSPALAILVLAGAYSAVCLLVFASDETVSLRTRIASLLIDIGLVTVWVQATGGGQSQFWTLYLIVVLSVALRFGMRETLGVATGLAVVHTVALVMAEGVQPFELVYRPALLIVTGFAVGVLAHRRAVHRRQREALERLAESRAGELGRERAAVARLREVDLERSEFVAVAAHEFRSPLAAIISVLSTLRTHGDSLEPSVRDELIDGASGQAKRLARLVEDLLTISRLGDGALLLSMESVDARDLIVEAARASGTVGRLRVEPGSGDRPVACDVDAVIRVLTNLLDNAGKYSPEDAPIVVSVSWDDGFVRFAVRDSGKGIPPGDRDAIFERFRRADGSGKPGAGLGLYISRGLAKAHGGELTVDDAPEGGARFTLSLPRELPGIPHSGPPGAPSSRLEQGRPNRGVNQVTAAAAGPR